MFVRVKARRTRPNQRFDRQTKQLIYKRGVGVMMDSAVERARCSLFLETCLDHCWNSKCEISEKCVHERGRSISEERRKSAGALWREPAASVSPLCSFESFPVSYYKAGQDSSSDGAFSLADVYLVGLLEPV